MENSSSFEIRDRFLGRYTVDYTASIRIGYTANHRLITAQIEHWMSSVKI